MLEGVCLNLLGVDATTSRIAGYPPYGDRLAILKQCASDLVPDKVDVLEHSAAMHAELLQQAGRWMVAYAREIEPDRPVSPFLTKAFGVSSAG